MRSCRQPTHMQVLSMLNCWGADAAAMRPFGDGDGGLTNEWMDERTRMTGWMDGRMDGWVVGWMHGWMDGCMDGCMDELMHEWMHGWIYGCMDGQIDR